MRRAILIHGAHVYPDGRLDVHINNRVEAGVKEFSRGGYEKIVTTGKGTSRPMRSHAVALLKQHVSYINPENSVAAENVSSSTGEQMYYANQLLKGYDQLGIVSNYWHKFRAIMNASVLLDKKLRFSFISAPDNRPRREVRHDEVLEVLKFLANVYFLSIPFARKRPYVWPKMFY